MIVFEAIAADGRSLFRTYDRFDQDTFIRFLRELHLRFGRIAVIMDNALACCITCLN